MAGGNSSGVVRAGAFRLPATRTTSVTVGNVKAKVITLAGTPGWVAFSTGGGRAGAKSASALTVTVRAADGTILASQTKSTGD